MTTKRATLMRGVNRETCWLIAREEGRKKEGEVHHKKGGEREALLTTAKYVLLQFQVVCFVFKTWVR